ncbi:MAG: TolC family protein [Bacteroidota bacterium]|nr:TolC family protein [Bacteroidota bacterium]
MQTNKPILILVGILFFSSAKAQQNDTLSFTIVQAIDFAIANNADVKNAYADVAIANETVKEVKAIGIPQLSGQALFQDNLQKPVFVFPVNGVATPIRVGNKYTTQTSLNLSWLMLDGTYFLGLKAAKEFTEMSKRVASKTETDVKIDVAKTYFMALIAKENIQLLNTSYETLNATLKEVTALNKEGFAESLDVDRLQLQLNNLDISRRKLNDQSVIALGLLKAKMGIPQEKPIKITDDIASLNQKFLLNESDPNLNLNARTDYQILKQQHLLNEYNLKRYRYGKYPNLAGAMVYQQSNFGETIDYSTNNWFGNSFMALQLNVPIFSGFANDAKIQKARIEIIKSENTLKNVENYINLEVSQTKLQYLRSLEYVEQQKENLELATRIFNITSIKYKEGVGSNLELITANQDLKTSQTNYLNAIYDLLVAKLDYQVAIGQTIKL